MTDFRLAVFLCSLFVFSEVSAAQHSALGEAVRNSGSASRTSLASHSSEIGDYRIGEQDVLKIVVWKEPELSSEATVRPDGRITIPLLNDITVVGMTPAELQAFLTERLKPYVNIPQVTVSVKEVNSRKVFLIGEVNRAGTFRISGNTTVLQILSEAGGLKVFAKRRNIYVLRVSSGKQIRFPFNYDDVIRGKQTDQNIVLAPGDTIVVP